MCERKTLHALVAILCNKLNVCLQYSSLAFGFSRVASNNLCTGFAERKWFVSRNGANELKVCNASEDRERERERVMACARESCNVTIVLPATLDEK